ncbi:ATP-grasp fold amidoligase family protein [Aquabacterium sp.]|uniref:ATP-grasp fold amidoligase family protein n=1 Tax=Aquabacterium sp. TaxID=1872578 RepID=UPI003B6E2C9D
MTFKEKFRLLRSGAYFEAHRQLGKIRASAESPWRRATREGYGRGIDHYRPEQLTWVVATAFKRFKAEFNHYPNIARPCTFNDKVMWFKFLGEIKIPESGNKLATGSFIPPSLRDQLTCVPLVWHGHSASLPQNHELPAGVYYLKASHGSGMFERICYPLSSEQRCRLLAIADEWLKRPFGLDDGEWWYNVFTPQLILEHSVTGENDSISWNFYVLNGEVPMVGLFLKSGATGQSYSTWLGPDFQPLPWQAAMPLVPSYEIGQRQHDMLRYALEIAKPFSAVRVDFLQGSDDRVYLCELTFSPGNAMTQRAPEVESMLSAPWKALR